MAPKPTPKPPAHLKKASRDWWAKVNSDYSLEDHHRRLLTLACESWERAQQARQAIEEHGLTFTDKAGQPRARPEVAIERDSRVVFARLLRELDLEGEPLPDPRLPRPHSAKR